MRLRIARNFAQFFDNVRGRRQIGVAHTEVDDVFARRARFRLHRIDFSEDVRRKAFDAVKFAVHDSVSGVLALLALCVAAVLCGRSCISTMASIQGHCDEVVETMWYCRVSSTSIMEINLRRPVALVGTYVHAVDRDPKALQ